MVQRNLGLEPKTATREQLVAAVEHASRMIDMQNKEIAILSQRLTRLTAQLNSSQQLELQLEMEQLNKRIAQLIKGHASEKRPAASSSAASAKPSQTGHGPKPQLTLETIPVKVSHDELDLQCPQCGKQLEPTNLAPDASFLLSYIPGRFVMKRVERCKYRGTCCGHLDQPTAPAELSPVIPGGRYDIDVAVHIAEQKYLDHLPLERQARQLARLGLELGSNTLWDQLQAAAELARPTWEALPGHIFRQPVIGMDQTGWPRLQGQKGERSNWQMWALACHDAVYYTIEDHKDAATAVRLLQSYSGTIVCDDLSTHKAAERQASFKLASCMVHVRRAFIEANTKKADGVLADIAELYRIEGEIGPQRDRTLDALRKQRRHVDSRAVMTRLRDRLDELGAQEKPTTPLGKAIRHALSVWPRLILFLDDPEIWLDNNLTERCLRGPAVGRRNHFGSKTVAGTQVAAIFYSLFETAKLAGVEPAAYVRQVVLNARAIAGTVTLPKDFDANRD